MRKLFRRGLLFLLVVVIAAAAPMAAAARTVPQEVSMETALIAVKTLVDIDDDVFTDFSYSSSYSNWETREGLVWYFYWSADNAYVYAVASAEGTLLQFSRWDFEGRHFGFAEISKDEAVARADAFIRSANPRTHQYYRAPESVSTSIHSSEFHLMYNAEVNGRAFPAAQISVSIDKFTGEVVRYHTRNVDPGRFRFEPATGLISQSAAVSAYAERIGLSLEYRSSFDWESNVLTVFPAYLRNSHGDSFISARTGQVVHYVYDLGEEDSASLAGGAGTGSPQAAMDAAEGDGGRRANITPAERAAIEQVAGFLSSEQALQKLLEAAGLADLDVRSFDEQHIGLNRDFLDRNRYLYNITMFRHLDWDADDDEIAGLFGNVDATTGRVMSFTFFYHGLPMSDSAMTDAQAEAAVNAFLRGIAPDELAKTRLEGRQSPAADRFGSRTGSFSFSFVRHENDIPFRDNGINVTFNQHTQRVTSFSLSWYENVTFPSVAGVLTQQRALSAFVDQNGSEIFYITTGEGNASIVYEFARHALIDPFTGRAMGHDGRPITDSTVTPAYGDVAGHWSELYVMRLLDNGVFLWGGRFEPNRVMTELEFLHYIMLIEASSFARVQPQAFFAQRGIDVEASADRQLTRQEAARIIVEYLGYGNLARQPQWFVYPFNDSVAEEYRGFITISYMLGIVSGDENGRFNAANNVTRAHAAVMLHNLILARS
jgi:hypothetical protein